jgi:hypothetical protein
MKRVHPHLADIRRELDRLAAPQIKTELDPKFEPDAGTLLKVEYDGSDWHMMPQDFRNLLAELPDGSGPAAIKQAIEAKVAHLWHGPSPEGSRDTSG